MLLTVTLISGWLCYDVVFTATVYYIRIYIRNGIFTNVRITYFVFPLEQYKKKIKCRHTKLNCILQLYCNN